MSLTSTLKTWCVMATALALLTLVGCGTGSGSTSRSNHTSSADSAVPGEASAEEDWKPVTIEHAFGETTLEERPDRVASWGWGSNDAAIALGVVPVAMPAQSYGGDESGVLPWNRDAIEKSGAQVPTILSEGEEPPYEEIIKASPDVILATYSGITEQQYDKLSKIAATVAYPGEAWSTPWREVITTTGAALGKSAEAEQVLADIDGKIADAADAHPEFQGKTIAAVADSGSFYVYTPADPRVAFLEDLGFESAPTVDDLDTGEATFYFTMSYEEVDKLESDVLVSYSDTQSAADKFLESESTQTMTQHDRGSIAPIVGEDLVAAVSPPTALSLTWGLDDFVTVLAASASKVDKAS